MEFEFFDLNGCCFRDEIERMIVFFLLGVASNVNILMGRSWGHGASIPNSVFLPVLSVFLRFTRF